jgi:hypothetical protein
MTKTGLHVVVPHAFPYAVASRVQKDRALFATIGWWRGQTAGLWCQTPLLHVGFDEDKPHLAKVHMHVAWSVCAYCREEVLGLEAVRNIVEFLAVTGKEERSGSWSIANANDISLYECWPVCGRLEGLVVSPVSIRHVRYRRLVVA